MKHRSLLVLAVLIFGFSSVDAQTRYARVITENANLRDTPSIASGTEQEIAEGSLVKVLDEKLPWYVVRFGNRVGWMHGNTIEFMEPQGSMLEAPRPQTVAPEYRPSAPAVPRRESTPEAPVRTSSENRGYIRGPRGGCYYYSGSGRKVYVDRRLCN
jgi:uncharacterized protein YraI